MGHALNKILKDLVVRSRSMFGFDAPYVPGWDCHGLPIEHQVEKTRGRDAKQLDAKAFRAACREFAMEQVEVQRKDFVRLGVMGDWARPYLTLAPGYEADIIALDGDPLTDLTAVRRVVFVMRGGVIYKWTGAARHGN